MEFIGAGKVLLSILELPAQCVGGLVVPEPQSVNLKATPQSIESPVDLTSTTKASPRVAAVSLQAGISLTTGGNTLCIVEARYGAGVMQCP